MVAQQQILLVKPIPRDFVPLSDIPGLIGWWDASVTASLTISGAADVDAVADQSGAGNHLVWSIARPTYSATGVNSRPGMIFAIGQALQKTSFPMGTGNTLTFFYVGTFGTTSSHVNGRTLSYTGAGQTNDYGNAGSWLLYRATATQMNFMRASNSTNKTSTASPAVHRLIGTVNSSGLMTLYADGVASSPITVGGNWISNGSFNVCRHSANTTECMAGSLAEFGVATGYMDATAIASLDTYLQTKWGL